MGRAPCCDKSGLKRGPWTPEEDQMLIDYINKNGCGNWRTLPKNAGLQRCGKSCRLRWTNYLRPDIKRGRFSFEEEETIIQLHSILGNKWSAIAARLPGRTDNEIKNYWNTHIRKRLLRMGIDPVTHSPRLDLLDLSSILNYANSQSHQMNNFSRLIGINQQLINPELIRLAASLFSSSQRQNQLDNYLIQNPIINNDCNQIIQPGQIQNPIQDFTAPTPISGIDHQIQAQLLQYDDVQQFSQNSAEFGQVNEWLHQSNGFVMEDYNLAGYENYGSGHQPVMDPNPSSDQSNNFSFNSVNLSNISTPSSSPTPLHSSSTYVNSSSSTAGEDEREREREREMSYCSSILKFDQITDILDVNDFM